MGVTGVTKSGLQSRHCKSTLLRLISVLFGLVKLVAKPLGIDTPKLLILRNFIRKLKNMLVTGVLKYSPESIYFKLTFKVFTKVVVTSSVTFVTFEVVIEADWKFI